MATKSQKTKGVHFIPILATREFPGTYSYPKPQQIPRGASQSSLNFITRRTWVETRPGYHPIGTEVGASGKVLGIFTAHKWDGTELLYRATMLGKLEYWDGTNWDEVGGAGANILAAAAAAGENVYMDEYLSPAGAQMWFSSPSLPGLYKILTANPASYLNHYNSTHNYKGRLRIIQNSMWMWHYATGLSEAAKASVQRSYIDSENYVTVTAESETVSTVGVTVTGTLLNNGHTPATSFAIQISYTDGAYSESFVDDYLGKLFGSNGGTGTVNYTTGAFVLTPNQAPASPVVTATYQYEDSTNGGIADFSKSGTRLAGQGVTWNQNNGGDILSVLPYNGSEYVLHQRNAWVITISNDDTNAQNVIFRNNISLSSEHGAISTSDGIYYIDTTISTRPYVALLEYNAFAAQVLPTDLSSDILDLSPYVFDQCVAYEWSDFIVFECRTQTSTQNNRMLVYNKKLSTSKMRIFDVLDYYGNCFTTYAGQLIAGDSLSNDVFKLFDGFDDDNSIPSCSWTGNIDDHGIEGLKQTKKLWIEGYIATNQTVGVYVQLDSGNPTLVGTISGKGTYVDTGLSVTIGSLQVGVYPVGGPSNQPVAFHYLMQITINSARYKYFTISFSPAGIGYFSFQMYANYDIRINVDKLPIKYRNYPPNVSPVTPITGIFTETPQGSIDGSNTSYSTKQIIAIIYSFSINGEAIDSSMYTFSNQTITFLNPLPVSLSGTPFEVVYGSTNPIVYTETPQGLINGSNTSYNVNRIIAVIYSFAINGTEIDSSMYTFSNQTISFGVALPASLSGTPFEVVYGSTNPVVHTETPQGLINGSNTVYTVNNSISSIFSFKLNGAEITSTQYSFSGNSIIFHTPIVSFLSGLPFEIVYD